MSRIHVYTQICRVRIQAYIFLYSSSDEFNVVRTFFFSDLHSHNSRCSLYLSFSFATTTSQFFFPIKKNYLARNSLLINNIHHFNHIKTTLIYIYLTKFTDNIINVALFYFTHVSTQTCLCQPPKSLHRCWKNFTFVVAFLLPACLPPRYQKLFPFKFLQLSFLNLFLILTSTALHPSPRGKQEGE